MAWQNEMFQVGKSRNSFSKAQSPLTPPKKVGAKHFQDQGGQDL